MGLVLCLRQFFQNLPRIIWRLSSPAVSHHQASLVPRPFDAQNTRMRFFSASACVISACAYFVRRRVWEPDYHQAETGGGARSRDCVVNSLIRATVRSQTPPLYEGVDFLGILCVTHAYAHAHFSNKRVIRELRIVSCPGGGVWVA